MTQPPSRAARAAAAKMPCPLDDAEVTWGAGVEGAGIDRVLPQLAAAGCADHRLR